MSNAHEGGAWWGSPAIVGVLPTFCPPERPATKRNDMGLLHAWRMQKLTSDARTAYGRGDAMFVAGFDIDSRARVPMKAVRKEIDKIITAVEPIGWQCVSVQPFLASVQIDFIRRA
ncbi:hypothetical protein [Streptomyces echinatus]|uniref:Uncharacterized protein n=1 Tax=Streptomyces echinatus TaxID=67293 RepID=A0A7W9PSF0_9ACTN|nr:hypothetical protein [Streptomyces echinatus]MBB5926407.1 hypothetical protein [Streptomyces echinatus]